ncbi:MAG: hypothetical protein L0287_38295, partial [Anaerolineae bacterium]|nr:hypothetical protein [Anaerolineae bacterium]
WDAVLQRRQNGTKIAERLDYRVVQERIIEQLFAVFKSWKETGVARYAVPDIQPSLEEQL